MKTFTLIVLVLGLSCALGAQSLRAKPQRTCQLSLYGPESPPVCETFIDENGQEQQQCWAVGSAAFAALLDKKTSSIKEATGLSEFSFDGYCKCTMKLWTGSNFTGRSKTIHFKDSQPHIFIKDIWSLESNSFSVSCKF